MTLPPRATRAWHGSIARLPRPKPLAPGSCRGRYHTDRQRGAALQNTAMAPPGPAGVCCIPLTGRARPCLDGYWLQGICLGCG